jgi:hypothetical protein
VVDHCCVLDEHRRDKNVLCGKRHRGRQRGKQRAPVRRDVAALIVPPLLTMAY